MIGTTRPHPPTFSSIVPTLPFFFVFFFGGGGSLMMMMPSAKPIHKSILVDKIMNNFRFFWSKSKQAVLSETHWMRKLCTFCLPVQKLINIWRIVSPAVEEVPGLNYSFCQDPIPGGDNHPAIIWSWENTSATKSQKLKHSKTKQRHVNNKCVLSNKTKRRPKIKKSGFKWAENSNLTPSPAPFF